MPLRPNGVEGREAVLLVGRPVGRPDEPGWEVARGRELEREREDDLRSFCASGMI